MSRVKNPREKKRLSLDRDRRNVYGENAKASRKNIPRSKQLSNMRIRHAAAQALAQIKGAADDSVASEAEALAKARTIALRKAGFRKVPDQPIRNVIDRQGRDWRRRAVVNALKAAEIPLGNEVLIEVADVEVRVSSENARRACEVLRALLEKSSWQEQ